MKYFLEIIGGSVCSLMIFKGLALFSIGLVSLFMNSSDSVLHFLLSFVFLVGVLYPIIIILMVLITIAITFSFCFPKNNNYKLWIGIAIAALIGYSNLDLLLGSPLLSAFNLDIILGIFLITMAILAGRFLTSRLSEETQQ